MRYNKIQNQYQYQRSRVSAAIRGCGTASEFLDRCLEFCAKQRVKIFILLALFAVPAWPQNALPTADAPPPSSITSRRYLLGDWGGERSALEEKGIYFDFFYITDMQANPTGGLQQTYAGWERVRGTVDINFDRMISWQGLSFHATGLWQSGANLGGKIQQ